MNLVCPNCGTSYDVDPSALGLAGRAVRCVRCRETWHAQVDDMTRADALEAAGDIGWDHAAGPEPADADAAGPSIDPTIPRVQSPPLANDDPGTEDWIAQARHEASVLSRPAGSRRGKLRTFAFGSGPAAGLGFSPPIAIAAMAALALALIIWRNDVVRLLPQTATFFELTGLGVNLRNLVFENVKVSTEMVNGNRIFVIEGAITGTSRKPVEIPRLRFIVQDAHGTDIYAWNAVVDQAVIRPGETVTFKSRLASPPAETHALIVRFFHPRDLSAGSV